MLSVKRANALRNSAAGRPAHLSLAKMDFKSSPEPIPSDVMKKAVRNTIVARKVRGCLRIDVDVLCEETLRVSLRPCAIYVPNASTIWTTRQDAGPLRFYDASKTSSVGAVKSILRIEIFHTIMCR